MNIPLFCHTTILYYRWKFQREGTHKLNIALLLPYQSRPVSVSSHVGLVPTNAMSSAAMRFTAKNIATPNQKHSIYIEQVFHQKGFAPKSFYTRGLFTKSPLYQEAVYTTNTFIPKTKAFTPHVCTLEHQIQKPFTPKISRKHFITNHFTPETFHTRRLFYDMAITPEAIHTRRLLQKTPFAPPALPQQNEAKAFYIRSPTMQNAIEKWHIHCNPGENRLMQNQPWEGQQWHPAPTQPCDALNT